MQVSYEASDSRLATTPEVLAVSHPMTNELTIDRVETVMRWVGSKRATAHVIACRMAHHLRGTYYEPFLGGASVFFALRTQNAVLGDGNSRLINAWRQIQHDPVSVWCALEKMPSTAETFYAAREKEDHSASEFEQAVTFLFLNRNCFNGLYRTNRAGKFNVPFGSATGRLPSKKAFIDCAQALEGAVLRDLDYSETVTDVAAGDVVYFDPPYWTSKFTYGEYGYSRHQPVTIDRLEASAKELAQRGANVFVSAPLEVPILSEFPRTLLKGRYTVSAKSHSRRESTEMLIHVPAENDAE